MLNFRRPLEGSMALAAGFGVLAVLAITLTACTRSQSRSGSAAYAANPVGEAGDMAFTDIGGPSATETATFALG